MPEYAADTLPGPGLRGEMDTATAPWICPFLRSVERGTLGDPFPIPDEANRCTALGDAAPQSLRQQEHACLVSAHVNCPRFVRGVLTVEPTAPASGARRQLTPAIVAALIVLAASFALSIGFVVANGGMDLPIAESADSPVASGAPSPAESSGSVDASAGPAASTQPSAAVPPSAGPSAAVTPTPSAAPTPATPSTPRPTSDRYALLTPCADGSACWIYVIRSGDNLVSIARYFGVPLEVVYDLNPWTRTTKLVAGQALRLPPPTR